jgi:hypothetical protein
MRLDIDDVPSVGDLAVVRPSAVVGMGLDDVPLAAEDGFVGGGRVHDHCVWAVAEDRAFEKALVRTVLFGCLDAGRTIFLLQSQKPDMAILFACVVERRQIRHFRPEGTGMFGQRVQVQSVVDGV